MNPFPGRLLRNRRALHLERLQGELRELEEQQREFVTESAERKDKDLDTMVSEDDEELWTHRPTVGRHTAATDTVTMLCNLHVYSLNVESLVDEVCYRIMSTFLISLLTFFTFLHKKFEMWPASLK